MSSEEKLKAVTGLIKEGNPDHNQHSAMSITASSLAGHKVGKWTVLKKLTKDGGTGGMFSSCYVVKSEDGEEAFLKAMNLEYTIQATGTGDGRMAKLKEMTAEYEQERLLCEICGDAGLDRVVTAVDWGEFDAPGALYFIPYIVFALCKEGDVRRHPKMKEASLAWRLRVFHGVAVGLKQLHSVEIYHQDLKPSNVLINTGNEAKIADLGRATTSAAGALHGGDRHWGDAGYMPIELAYGHHEPDPDIRRRAGDLYMLGGVLAFLVGNVEFFGKILMEIPPEYHPKKWRGKYLEAYPVVQSATFRVIEELVIPLHPKLVGEVREMLVWLCHPNPQERGHPGTVSQMTGDRYSMERIVSHADRVANLARYYT